MPKIPPRSLPSPLRRVALVGAAVALAIAGLALSVAIVVGAGPRVAVIVALVAVAAVKLPTLALVGWAIRHGSATTSAPDAQPMTSLPTDDRDMVPR